MPQSIAQGLTREHVPRALAELDGAVDHLFGDSILQMWAAFCDELAHGRNGMRQPLYCATPSEAAETHVLFTAALESHATGQTSRPLWE